MSIENQKAWEHVCRRNAAISAWRKERAAKRTEAFLRLKAGADAQHEFLVSKQQKLIERAASAARERGESGVDPSTVPKQLLFFAEWLEVGTGLQDHSKAWGISHDLGQKWVQRARKKLVDLEVITKEEAKSLRKPFRKIPPVLNEVELRRMARQEVP